MIKELDLLDNYEEFITDLNSDPCFSNPMLASEEDIKDNLYNALNKPNDHVFGVFQDGRMIGLFVFLILNEEKYIEMIIGLSRHRMAYEEILAYLQANFPGFQADFVFNPENRILKELLVQKHASFDTEQQKMILNDQDLAVSTEGIETLSEHNRQQYIAIHDNDRYWTGEKTAEAVERFNVFVATENDDVIGYLDITNCYDDNEIFDLLVLEPYRRRGWGRKLMAEAIKVNRLKKMFLTVDVDNIPAIRLYESMGFEKVNGQNSQTVNWIMPAKEYKNDIVIKKIETEDEIKGKAYVHWKAWHEAYPGMVKKEYLDRLTLEKCEQIAFGWTDSMLIAKDGENVIGFLGFGHREGEPTDSGEVFAIYVLSEYYGKGVGVKLMEAALEQLKDYPKIYLWTLKENKRAIRFYQKCGFYPDGREKMNVNLDATEIRMVCKKQPLDQEIL